MAKSDKQIKIVTYRKEETERKYSNYVRVVTNPVEVTLQFADIKPGATDEEHAEMTAKGQIDVPIDYEIVMRIDVAESLLNVLKTQLEKIKTDK